MTTPSTAQIELARRLPVRALRSPSDLNEPAYAAARVYEAILAQLSPLIGTSGVHALVSRSVRLAASQHPCLEAYSEQTSASGSDSALSAAERLCDCLKHQQASEQLEPAVAVFANMFLLLTSFIGSRLTTQVLDGAWPEPTVSVPIERKK